VIGSSLGNTFSADELLTFNKKVHSGIPVDRQLEYKIDGLAINLTYENGRLVSGVTRGNGIIWLKRGLFNNRLFINEGISLISVA